MQSLSLTAKLWAHVLAVATVCLGLSAVLAHAGFERVLLDLKEGHFRFVVNDVGGSIRNLTAIGLPLSALRRCQDVIDQVKSDDPEIGAIVIFGPTGEVLYSTDQGEIGTAVPPAWLAVSGGTGTTTRTTDELVVAAPLNNGLGDFAGGVALRFAVANLAPHLEEAWLLLGGLAAAGLALAAVAGWLGVRRVAGPLARGLRQGAVGLLALARTGAATTPKSLPAWLLPLFQRYVARARRCLEAIDHGMAVASDIDEHG